MGSMLPLAGRESPCRDNTIEGNVGVWASRILRLMARDNGDARAGGQPARRAFPKAFARLKRVLAPTRFRDGIQLLSSGLTSFSNSSNEGGASSGLPLTKKKGVPLTLSVS
jgi:hypothetical protein